MPNLLKFKRGTAATIPVGSAAEPLFTTDTYDLYIGKGNGSNQRFQKYIASGTSSQFLKGDGSLDSNSYQTALTFSSPLVNTSGTISIPAATGSVNGYLTSTDWTTFNNKQASLTLTTTGTSGAATLVGATLNIPQYQSVLTNPVTGTGTLNQIAYWTSTSQIGSLTTATYPSLTELSYVKGVTSAIQTQLNAKEPSITAGTSLQYYRGDKTFQTLNTAAVPESGSIYFTEPRVLATVLTGLNLSGGGTIAATDSIITAFGKIQNQISGIAGGVSYQTTWNASTNIPTLTSSVGTKGYYYVVSVAGSTNLNGITDWKVGDWAIFNGTAWDKVDNTDAVSSVNGFTGAVNLGLGDISNVTLSSPTNTQLLRFNGTSSKWENWTPTYISGNQTITLSGDVSGSGSTAITTTIGALKVTNAMLAGTIDYAKMDATTVPTWNQNTTGSAATLTTARTLTIGSTGKTFNGSANVTWTLAEIGAFANPMTTLGDIIYGGASGAATRLAGNTVASKRFLTQTGDGTNSAAPSWGTISAGDIPSLSYLPLSGGTLTGALSGTSATFSTWVLANDGTRQIYLNPAADFGNGALPTVQVSSNHALQFATNNSLRLTISSTGAATFSNSITTTSGGLYVQATNYDFFIPSNYANTINFGYNTNTNLGGWVNFTGYQNGTTQFRDFNIGNGKNGVVAFFQGSSGNVGIGTTSPLRALHINAANTITDDYGQVFISTSDAQAADKGGQLTLGGFWNGSAQAAFGGITGRKDNSTSGDAKGYLAFYSLNSTLQERMRITSAGNVGIGNTNSVNKLRVTVDESNSIVTGLVINNPSVVDSGTAGVAIAFMNEGGGAAINYTAKIAGIRTGAYSQGALAFYTNSTASGAADNTVERMRITSGGAIQIKGTLQTYAPGSTSVLGDTWKLGGFTNTSVSPATGYLYVQVNGASYYIGLVNPL